MVWGRMGSLETVLEGWGWTLAGRGFGAQGLGSSLLGACLHAGSRTRVVANLSPKLQSHSHIAVIHAQHSHLVLGGALSTPQGICPGLETRHVTQQDPQGSPVIPEPGSFPILPGRGWCPPCCSISDALCATARH